MMRALAFSHIQVRLDKIAEAVKCGNELAEWTTAAVEAYAENPPTPAQLDQINALQSQAERLERDAFDLSYQLRFLAATEFTKEAQP